MPQVTCPACGEETAGDAAWCEACGADLSSEPAVPCVDCGGLDISDDGYCMSCGHKQPAERDHLELVSSGLDDPDGAWRGGVTAAVTDRGVRHHHNEDSVAIAGRGHGVGVLVVCDGVSSTPGSAEASMHAAEAARDLLVKQTDAAAGTPPTVDDVATWLTDAAVTAQERAAAAPEVDSSAPYGHGGPPSSTFVAAVGLPYGLADGVAGEAEMIPGTPVVAAAWIGDSRAYWLPAGGSAGAEQLTDDHEIAGSLSRWIGADAPEGPIDSVIRFAPEPGWLLVCSDGLWRYADEPKAMWDLVQAVGADHVPMGNVDETTATTAEALHLAAGLVAHAKDAGGHDNISVALWSAPGLPASDRPHSSSPTDSSLRTTGETS